MSPPKSTSQVVHPHNPGPISHKGCCWSPRRNVYHICTAREMQKKSREKIPEEKLLRKMSHCGAGLTLENVNVISHFQLWLTMRKTAKWKVFCAFCVACSMFPVPCFHCLWVGSVLDFTPTLLLYLQSHNKSIKEATATRRRKWQFHVNCQ